MRHKLTDLTIRQLPAPEKGYAKYWDSLLPGFGVRVTHTGVKSFITMFGSDRRSKTLGRYPAMSLKQARQAALEVRATDPSQLRIQALKDAISAFLEDCEGRVRPSTVDGYRFRLKAMEGKLLSDVTKASIPNTPQHIMAAKVFFNWCIRKELIERNPFAYEKARFRQRDRLLSDAEAKLIWQHEFPPYSDYLKLLFLTGQRRGQFLNFEIRDDTVYFPAEAMKAGIAHEIPLTEWTRSYLVDLLPFKGWSKAAARIKKHVDVQRWFGWFEQFRAVS